MGLAIEQKYRHGQEQHGGELWRKAGMLSHCEAEAWDLAVYLCTLREQLDELVKEMRRHGHTYPLLYAEKLERIIGAAQE